VDLNLIPFALLTSIPTEPLELQMARLDRLDKSRPVPVVSVQVSLVLAYILDFAGVEQVLVIQAYISGLIIDSEACDSC